MVHVGRPHAAVPYAHSGGSGGDPAPGAGPMKQDPPNSGLYVPDTSKVEDNDG